MSPNRSCQLLYTNSDCTRQPFSPAFPALLMRLALVVVAVYLGQAEPIAQAAADSPYEAHIERIAYPSGKSFQKVCLEYVVPYTVRFIEEPVTYGEVTLALWDLLPEARRRFLRKSMSRANLDERTLRQLYSGAHVNLHTGRIVFRTGKTIRPSPGTSLERLAVAMANFEHGIGLILDIQRLRFGIYFSPISWNHVRAFSVAPNGVYDDKTYLDLDYAQQKIRNPLYYLALLDAAIKGEFDLAARLSIFEQHTMVDTLGISLAECFVGYRGPSLYHHQLQLSVMREWQRDHSKNIFHVRLAPPFLNAFLGQLYNLGVSMIVEDGKQQMRIGKGALKYLYNGSEYHPPERALNELLITRGLLIAHPHEFALIRARIGDQHSDNLFDLLAYLVQHPEYYDEQLRLALWQIIRSWESDVPLINGIMKAHIDATLRDRPGPGGVRRANVH